MKQGRSLQELAAELERIEDSKKDYVAEQGALSTVVANGNLALTGLSDNPMPIRNFAHGQFSTRLGIPRPYYNRMLRDQPGLLTTNINTWLAAGKDDKRMIRTIDNEVRAVLSPRYRPLDNGPMAEVVLPKLIEQGVKVMSCELTETKMYIKGILPSLSDELPDGLSWGAGHHAIGRMGAQERDGRVVAAIVISNSEVGDGSFRIEPSMFTTWCTNLAIMAKAAMKKYHVGRAFTADDNYEIFRDETRKLDDKAFWAKVGDVTKAAFSDKIWNAAMEQMRNANKAVITGPLPKVVEVTATRFRLSEDQSGNVLTHLAAGGNLTQWGLSNAITRVANTEDNYESATHLERIGGEVLALPEGQWVKISEAVPA